MPRSHIMGISFLERKKIDAILSKPESWRCKVFKAVQGKVTPVTVILLHGQLVICKLGWRMTVTTDVMPHRPTHWFINIEH